MIKDYKKVLFVFVFLAFSGLIRINIDKTFNDIKKKSVFIPPPQTISLFTFGFDEIIANSLWLRWIQNIEACGANLKKRGEVLQSTAVNEDEFTGRLFKAQKKMICDQGWSFRMLNAITDLSPMFRMPYALGAPSLSIIAEDHIGAKILYNKALKYYPNDWAILYRGAYHFLFELNDLPTAAKWLKFAADNGAPDWLYSLSARVSTQSGKIEFGIKVLEDYIKTQTNPLYLNDLKERLRKLREQLSK